MKTPVLFAEISYTTLLFCHFLGLFYQLQCWEMMVYTFWELGTWETEASPCHSKGCFPPSWRIAGSLLCFRLGKFMHKNICKWFIVFPVPVGIALVRSPALFCYFLPKQLQTPSSGPQKRALFVWQIRSIKIGSTVVHGSSYPSHFAFSKRNSSKPTSMLPLVIP